MRCTKSWRPKLNMISELAAKIEFVRSSHEVCVWLWHPLAAHAARTIRRILARRWNAALNKKTTSHGPQGSWRFALAQHSGRTVEFCWGFERMGCDLPSCNSLSLTFEHWKNRWRFIACKIITPTFIRITDQILPLLSMSVCLWPNYFPLSKIPPEN